jgi:hypothetical protein
VIAIQKASRVSIVCTMSDKDFAKLRISRAYFDLMCLPEGDARMISLAWIGNYEIRMLEPSSTSSDDAALFLIELFDYDAGSTVDLCVCYAIEEGAVAFEAFVSR